MERYNKYLVLKIADIEKYLSDEKQLKLDALVTCIRVGRLNDGKRDQEYVCVAADWPMHEQVWGMVEAFVDGKPNEIEQLKAKVAELEEENAATALNANECRLTLIHQIHELADHIERANYCISDQDMLKQINGQREYALEVSSKWNQNGNPFLSLPSNTSDANLTKAQESQLTNLRQRLYQLKGADSTIDSERQANCELTEQLAAEQLNNKLLRKALENHSGNYKLSKAECSVINELIDKSASTETLDKYVAEKVNAKQLLIDAMGKQVQEFSDLLNAKIATLTWQRDLAVEAMEKASDGIKAELSDNGKEKVAYFLPEGVAE